jgi:hypothetical protein
LIAVIALVADDFLDACTAGPHGLDLLGGINQRVAAGRIQPRIRLAGRPSSA